MAIIMVYKMMIRMRRCLIENPANSVLRTEIRNPEEH